MGRLLVVTGLIKVTYSRIIWITECMSSTVFPVDSVLLVFTIKLSLNMDLIEIQKFSNEL